jgi:hypothetical protein
MKEESMTDALVREFLLGKLTDEERERIENLFLTDPQTKERVLTLEDDLIEEYLEDNLTEADKERFLARYAQTDEQRRKLRITKTIKDWAVTQAKAPQTAAATVAIWNRLWTRLRLKPAFAVPIAVTIVIAIVLAVVWLNSQMERRKHLAVEQELAQLNSPPSLRETPPNMISFELRSVNVRSDKPERGINRGADTQIIEMRLLLMQTERYPMYQAQVRRIGDTKSFSIPNLQPENDGGYRIRIRLPARLLRRGSYQIQLRGVANEGTFGPPEEYPFFVEG